MSTEKDESAKDQNREIPKEQSIIPGDSDSRDWRGGVLGELHGDVRKGQKPGKLED